MAETAPAEFPFPNLGIFPANLRSHPKEKEVQLWKGSVVRSQMPINERVYDWFIPLTESDDGIGIRERWLSIDDPSSTGGWGGVKTVRILQDGLLRAMSNSLKLAYAIEEAREDAASVAVTTNTPRVDLEKYTLNCSLLVPENFSAYNDVRAPTIILHRDFELTAENPVQIYRGPVDWQIPVLDERSGGTKRQSRFSRLSSSARSGPSQITWL
ncbi:hypothetical protein I302_107329 [Kwoniella bestiolae CBS 10118]|uniref:Uncharacterized protein n=1 Tax=Kwoniella bestiolae CBS 10118 TaxID=1296100 RepID=A0AAJ8KCD1_9TREE